MAPARLFLCATCSRYSPARIGELSRGEQLITAVKGAALKVGVNVTVRSVECLNSCPNSCAAALRAQGKTLLRFARLDISDATALVNVAVQYMQSATGDIPSTELPEQLRGKLVDRIDTSAVVTSV